MTKEQTPEEKAKQEAEEKLYKTRLSNLETLSIYAGAQNLSGEKNKFGEIGARAGKAAYTKFMTSTDADKYRKELYAEKMEDAAGLGTVATPDYPTNFELEKTAIGLIQDASLMVTLGDLEKKVGGISKELKFKVPEKFKELTIAKLQKKIQEKTAEAKAKGEKYKISEEENDVMLIYQTLMDAYGLGSAFKVVQESYMDDVNAVSKEFNEKYKPKEKKD